MKVAFLVLLFILGSCFGSFLCCQARRLHHKAQKKGKKLGSRSVCLHCNHQLKWHDNIPIFSWLFLRGRCRKCHKKIGCAEILSELGLGLAWLALGATFNYQTATPLEWTTIVTVFIFSLPLALLAIYDGLYGELPTKSLIVSLILAAVILSLKQTVIILARGFTPNLILLPLGSILILGGLYLVLYLVSRGKWVGDGDWLLGTAIGAALASPWLALITLFISNLLACLASLPHLKSMKTAKVHLGPFLVVSFFAVYSLSDFLMSLIP